MDAFWKWMEEKAYGLIERILPGNSRLLIYTKGRAIITPTEQMLIGYMMEYLDEKFPGWQKRPTWTDCNTTENRNRWLVSKINALKEG